eukprot:CAMPEP_0117540844 /NCGR_PEP_ID=MMETSP0784-20121206/43709_1 /TAXON_ID=39447 /ORGANISM="" /LENGTH=98 /DNA_ID=CAMNT_0005337513 /DNA_START=2213 /DNA_END=2506 /DNA_ORIENTATION=+
MTEGELGATTLAHETFVQRDELSVARVLLEKTPSASFAFENHVIAARVLEEVTELDSGGARAHDAIVVLLGYGGVVHSCNPGQRAQRQSKEQSFDSYN